MDAWSLFKHAKCTVYSFSPRCFEALLTECEHRGLLHDEIALLKGLPRLEGTRGDNVGEMSFRAASTQRVAAMRLVKANGIELPDSGGGD